MIIPKVIDEISLDLSKESLEYWEQEKLRENDYRTFKRPSFLVVEAMREGIRLGHKFPPVYVIKSEEGTYQINFGMLDEVQWGRFPEEQKPEDFNYGGLHRTISHYLERTPLRCKVLDNHFYPGDWLPGYIDFKDTLECKGFSDKTNGDSLREAINHLPRDIAKSFCEKHNLNFVEYVDN